MSYRMHLGVVLAFVLVALAGCVEKTVTITSDPVGATLEVTSPQRPSMTPIRATTPLTRKVVFEKDTDTYFVVLKKSDHDDQTRSITSDPAVTNYHIVLRRSKTLTITSDPPGSTVTVKDLAGKIVASGMAPLSAGVHFPTGSERYVVEVAPSLAMAERYLPRSQELAKSQFDAMSLGSDATRQMAIKLDEKQFTTVTTLQVTMDRKGKWQGVVTPTRSYRNITETGGAQAALIKDLSEDLAVQGLALAPAKEGEEIRMAFSAAQATRRITDVTPTAMLNEDRTLTILACNIYLLRIGSGGLQQVTRENYRDLYPAFTSDGIHILFASNRRRADREDILRINADGRTGISNVYTDYRNAHLLKPTQSKDGTIAFSVHFDSAEDDNAQGSGSAQIWTLEGPNAYPTQITCGIQPAISPDGKRITYIGADGNLWVINADSSNETQLTSEAAQIVDRFKKSLGKWELDLYELNEKEGYQQIYPFSFPSWSPDGQWILYSSLEGNDPTGRPNEDVWIMKYDGTGKQQLTTNGSSDRFPLMAPDMKSIYFLSNRGGRWAIWRIAAPQAEAAK